MQKVINVLAVLSFLGTASIVGAGAYVYINKDSLIEQAKEADYQGSNRSSCRCSSWNVRWNDA